MVLDFQMALMLLMEQTIEPQSWKIRIKFHGKRVVD